MCDQNDDIVLIHDKNLERGQWQVGQITSSSDDFQRSAEVRLPSRRLITRPINLLYKFEIENGKGHEGNQPNASLETPTPTEKGHPMMTRSKTILKNAATLFTFIAILAHCDTVNANTRCPSELTLQKTIIYATNCASQGVAVAKYKLDGSDKLCWLPISCPFGAIQIPTRGLRKQLIRQCDAIEQILRDYNVPEKGATLAHLTTEEITAFREELANAQDQLLQIYIKIEQLHTDWLRAQASDPKEEEVFRQYVDKYGDYTKKIQRAVSVLENVDELMNTVDADFVKRRLPTPKKHADTPKLPHPNGKQQEWTRPSQPQTNSTPTMNFVDASILSRLDLPSFDGNLLEYSEFFSRFSTLIGNKTELDYTTKFSFLKSCLKGRALYSIEGLTLTASSYHIALDILKTRYDDKVTTRHILFSQLANLPQCDHEGRNLNRK
ncbi:hypothetical protein RB195_009516 [Necator americanus]|uniref:DUF5641 domain-containing protein n=1 Tax=Necator americanus TaxID=51031 RepID=A0ABR1CUW7_NECAM